MRRIIPINGIAGIHDSVLYVKYVKHDPGAEHRKDHKQDQLNPKTLPVTDKMMLIFRQHRALPAISHRVQKDQKDQ